MLINTVIALNVPTVSIITALRNSLLKELLMHATRTIVQVLFKVAQVLSKLSPMTI